MAYQNIGTYENVAFRLGRVVRTAEESREKKVWVHLGEFGECLAYAPLWSGDELLNKQVICLQNAPGMDALEEVQTLVTGIVSH